MLKEIKAWFRGKTEPEIKPTIPRLFDDKIGQMLAALGKKPEEVAAALQAQGICGTRRNVFTCPIANRISQLLRENVPDGDLYVSVSREAYTANWFPPPPSDKAVLLARGPLPQPVAELIRRFDNADFPELEAEL